MCRNLGGGVEPRRDGRTAKPWFALDCSGRDRLHQVCREREGSFTVWGTPGSRSSAVFDPDGDGTWTSLPEFS